MRQFNFAFWLRNFVLRHFHFAVELKKSIFGGILFVCVDFSDLNRETAKFSCRENFLPWSRALRKLSKEITLRCVNCSVKFVSFSFHPIFYFLREKCSNTEFSDWIWENGDQKTTPYLNTFHTVHVLSSCNQFFYYSIIWVYFLSLTPDHN